MVFFTISSKSALVQLMVWLLSAYQVTSHCIHRCWTTCHSLRPCGVTAQCSSWPLHAIYLQMYHNDQNISGRTNSLAQDCGNSIANALELLQSCIKPSIRITVFWPPYGMTHHLRHIWPLLWHLAETIFAIISESANLKSCYKFLLCHPWLQQIIRWQHYVVFII